MTKVIQFSEIVRICEQKKQTGDIYTLSKMLDCITDANIVDHFLARVKNEAERGRVIIVKDEDDKFMY